VEESAAAAEGLQAQAQQMVQAVAVFKLNEQTSAAPATQATASHTRVKLKQSISDVPVLSREVAATTTDRRGPERAKNVTRPDFKAHSAAPASAPVAKTGTDDWESF
jgi:methyl-accepting chemotaxis protein